MPEQQDEPDQAPPYRAQILATEHWSLLASRSTTQSEVLTRITMFLTLVSAGLVSVALVGQATGFSGEFRLFAVVVLAFISIAGVLTQVRVVNVGEEDLMYVLAMNRLRGAYLDLDPGVEPYLMASPYDDAAGMSRTYFFLGPRTSFSQVAGSSMLYIVVVVAMLIGLLGATITAAFGGTTGLAILIGVIAGLVYAVATLARGARRFYTFWRTYRALKQTPEGREFG
jgi:hypothetical protein